MFRYSYLASKIRKGVQLLKLREAREAANFTQQQVADQLGISRPTYISMEKNPDRIRIDEAVKLAEMFRVSVNEIFFATDCN